VGLVDGALAEPTAVSVHALSRSGVQEGRPVLIVGAGMIGLVLMKAAGAIGCPVVVVEATAERVGRALDLGADKAFAFDEVEPGEVAAAAGPDGFGAVFECVGSPGTIDFAVRAAPRGGTVVAVGVFPGAVPVPMSLVQDGEVEIRGTLMYRGEDFKRALELLDGGLVRADDIITHRLALDEVERAYRLAGDPGARSLKVMLEL
jgi:L-iditol 2-dehydrogenase